MNKTNGSVFIDEFILEKNMVCPLNKPAMYVKIHPNLPLIWVALAGIRDGKIEDFETMSLSDSLPMFTIAKLNMPILTSKSVLKTAGLVDETVQRIANVIYGVMTSLFPHIFSLE